MIAFDETGLVFLAEDDIEHVTMYADALAYFDDMQASSDHPADRAASLRTVEAVEEVARQLRAKYEAQVAAQAA